MVPDPRPLGSGMFNIIITIINIIIFIVINMIINKLKKNIITIKKIINLIWRVKLKLKFIIIIIIIINFLKNILLLLKKNHKFDLKSKIKNYKNLRHACLLLLLLLLLNLKNNWFDLKGKIMVVVNIIYIIINKLKNYYYWKK